MPVFPVLEVRQGGRTFYLTRLPAGLITRIAYAAIRRVHDEEGAVQRILNTRRINSIKDFTLSGGDYPNVVILNWRTDKAQLRFPDPTHIEIPDTEAVAQLIDGQHRVAGIKAAIAENAEVATLEVPVAIYLDLNTAECANIFLSINTEQKPVPRSLVFDLYGVADEQVIDTAAARARDIAMSLNDDEDSPYRGEIKLPGAGRRKGGVALSTAVSAIKPLVEDKGDLEQIGIRELETQKQIFLNLFSVLKEKYGEHWYDKTNAFMYASGFVGAIEFLRLKLIPYCNARRSFKRDVIWDAIDMNKDTLIFQEEVKGKGGKDAPKVIYDKLLSTFVPDQEIGGPIEV